MTNGSAIGCGRCNSNSGSAAPKSTRRCADLDCRTRLRRKPPGLTDAGGIGPPCRSTPDSLPATTTDWECPDLPTNLNLPNRRMRTRMSGGVAGE